MLPTTYKVFTVILMTSILGMKDLNPGGGVMQEGGALSVAVCFQSPHSQAPVPHALLGSILTARQWIAGEVTALIQEQGRRCSALIWLGQHIKKLTMGERGGQGEGL